MSLEDFEKISHINKDDLWTLRAGNKYQLILLYGDKKLLYVRTSLLKIVNGSYYFSVPGDEAGKLKPSTWPVLPEDYGSLWAVRYIV